LTSTQAGVTKQARHVAHHARLGDHGGQGRFLHRLGDGVIGVAEGPRRVVTVQRGKDATGAKHSRGLLEDTKRVSDVTDRGMRDDGVHGCVRDIEGVHVADAELDALANAFIGRKPAGNFDEQRTLLDADHAAREGHAAVSARATTPVPQPRSRMTALRAKAIFST
jgi:hypothetical protein